MKLKETLLNLPIRYVFNRPGHKDGNGGACLSDFWMRRCERNAALAHGIGCMRRVDVEAAGLECLRSGTAEILVS